MPETHSLPKTYFPDEGAAWAAVVNRHALNADMLVSAQHTADEWSWTFERTA